MTVIASEEGLFVELDSSAISDEVVVNYIHGHETISELFMYEVRFSCKNRSLDGEKMLNSKATITIHSPEHERFINGIIAEFSQGFTSQSEDIFLTEYTVILRPQLWTLSLDSNCKIFQNKTIIDIIKSVLKEGKVTDISDKTSKRGKTKREYCVQYNESSFQFVSRLMEDDGIFYYFTHEKGKHTLVLTDSSSSYKKINGKSDANFVNYKSETYLLGKVYDARTNFAINSGGYSLSDYNYKISQTKLFTKLDSKWKGSMVYEYPGGFEKSNEGEDLSKLRVQAFEFFHSMLNGHSTVASFVPGATFDLKNHPLDSFNSSYVLYSVEHFFERNLSSGLIYKNRFSAFKKDVEFRALRKTPKPKVFGNQTAVVVCPSGKEIFRDEFCAIKVHFHWDQEGKAKDTDDSSCWIRVAQLLSGSGWGGVYVPRVGQEVVVSFLEGDPDRPLVVGCVYNDQFKPPYSDSDDMKSTIKTVTFTDDQGFNEFRFYDEKDKEEIYLHAQKDLYSDIINSRKTEIEESDDTLDIFKGSRKITLQAQGDDKGNHSLELTKGDKSVKITEGNDSVLLEKGDRSIALKEGKLTYLLEKGDASATLKEGKLTYLLEKGDESITLKNGNLIVDITGNCTFKVSKDFTLKADGNVTLESGKDFKIKSGKNANIEASMALNEKSGTDFKMKAGTNMNAEASVNFEAKGTNVTVQSTANLMLKGMNVNIQAMINVALMANAMFNVQCMAGLKVTTTMADVTSAAAIRLTGALIQLSGAIKLG